MRDLTINLPVYEPAGRDVKLTEAELLQHVLIIGSTGSGKTALLHRFIEQAIRIPGMGLLIFDAKQDDIVHRIQAVAQQANRLNDVVVVGPAGDRYLNLFGGLRSLSDVETTAQRLLLAAGPMSRENAYWEEARAAMLDAALTVLVASGNLVRFSQACDFMGQWFFRPAVSSRVSTVLDAARKSATSLTGAERRKVFQALDMAELWNTLDNRTKSNIASTLACAIKPLLGVPAAGCFQSGGRRSFNPADVVRKGRIGVVSCNATTDPALASLFFRIAKGDFLREVQQADSRSPLCGIIADEWPLIVSAEDVNALATVRSRGCFIIAATQGIAAIDERLGVRRRKAMMTNFGTLILLRSREEEVDLLAAVQLGMKRKWITKDQNSGSSDLVTQDRYRFAYQELACPPGTLGRLAPHEGFVVSPGQSPSDVPRVFVPWFDDSGREIVQQHLKTSPEHLQRLLRRLGFAHRTSAAAFAGAMAELSTGMDHAGILADARNFFRSRAVLVPDGLECIPSPWLKALPRILWSTRRPGWTHLPFMLSRVELSHGLLVLQFAQELYLASETRVTSFDRLRIRVNASLYPNMYRPLKPRHLPQARERRPSLDGATQEM